MVILYQLVRVRELILCHSAALQDVFIFRPLLPYLTAIGPPWFRRRIAEFIPYAPFQRIKSLIDTMAAHSEEIFVEKKSTLGEDDIADTERADIMAVLGEFDPVAPPDHLLN